MWHISSLSASIHHQPCTLRYATLRYATLLQRYATLRHTTHVRIESEDGRLALAVDDVGVVHVDQAGPQVVPTAPASGRMQHNDAASYLLFRHERIGRSKATLQLAHTTTTTTNNNNNSNNNNNNENNNNNNNENNDHARQPPHT